MPEHPTFDSSLSSFTEKAKALQRAADAARAALDDTNPIPIPQVPSSVAAKPSVPDADTVHARLTSIEDLLLEMAAIKEQLLAERAKQRAVSQGWKETESVLDQERAELAVELKKIRDRTQEQARRLQEATKALERAEAMRLESEERMRKALALESAVHRGQGAAGREPPTASAPEGGSDPAFFKRELEEIGVRLMAALRAEIGIVESRWRDHLK